MLAILYSSAAMMTRVATLLSQPLTNPTPCSRARLGISVSLAFLLQATVSIASPLFAARSEHAFLTNRARFQIEKTNVLAAWQFGRACFDWAEFAKTNKEREAVAQEGIAACGRSLLLKPDLAAGHYYLALNLGQLARTKTLGALKIVLEMERELRAAIELDAMVDYAGPHRSLGLLYLEAPGWPTSIGSRSKARVHLEKAVELSSDYPENRLCLLEACLKWNDKKSIEREGKALKELLPRARKILADDAWQENWVDWDKRWSSVEKGVQTKRELR